MQIEILYKGARLYFSLQFTYSSFRLSVVHLTLSHYCFCKQQVIVFQWELAILRIDTISLGPFGI